MLPSKKKKKRGFILLEAVVFITLMMVLGAAMLSASYNDRVRSLEYSTNNQAYNAALSALQLLVDGESTRLLNGQDLQYLTNSPAESPLSTQITITTSEDITVTIPVDIAIASAENNSFTLTATANVGTQSETVQMVVQYHDADTIPSLLYSIEQSNSNTVLYGSGLAGKLTASNGSNTFRLNLGADTDLYLFDQDSTQNLTFIDSTIGGNVLVPGQVSDTTITIENSSIGGILIANRNLTISNSVFGNVASTVSGSTVNRLSGIYSLGKLTVKPGVIVNGDVYSTSLRYEGGSSISGSAYCASVDVGDAVYGNDGNGVYTLTNGYRRGDSYGYRSSTGFAPLTWQDFPVLSSPLSMYIPTFPSTMKTFDNGQTPENNVGLYGIVTSNSSATISNAPACDINGTSKVGSIIVLEPNATLTLSGKGPFYLMVYGSDTSSTVNIDSGATVYGCLQNVNVNILTNGTDTPILTLSYLEPITINNTSILNAPASNGKTTPYFHLVSVQRVVDQTSSYSQEEGT